MQSDWGYFSWVSVQIKWKWFPFWKYVSKSVGYWFPLWILLAGIHSGLVTIGNMLCTVPSRNSKVGSRWYTLAIFDHEMEVQEKRMKKKMRDEERSMRWRKKTMDKEAEGGRRRWRNVENLGGRWWWRRKKKKYPYNFLHHRSQSGRWRPASEEALRRGISTWWNRGRSEAASSDLLLLDPRGILGDGRPPNRRHRPAVSQIWNSLRSRHRRLPRRHAFLRNAYIPLSGLSLTSL